MRVRIKGLDENDLSFMQHLKRKHGESCVTQYMQFIKKKKTFLKIISQM